MTPERKSLLKRVATWVGLASGIIAIITFFANSDLRPAMAWEIAELKMEQKELQLDFYKGDRRELNERLFDNRLEQQRRIEQNQPVPHWLKKQENDMQQDLQELEEDIDRIQQELLK